MAIKIRRGAYSNYDASQLLQGEMALVTSGDPSTTDGIGLYIASSDGTAKQIAFSDQVEDAADSATAAATDAETYAEQAQTAAAQAMSGTPAGYAQVVSNVNALVAGFLNGLGAGIEIAIDEMYVSTVPYPQLTITCSDATFIIYFDEDNRSIHYERYDSGGSLIFQMEIS